MLVGYSETVLNLLHFKLCTTCVFLQINYLCNINEDSIVQKNYSITENKHVKFVLKSDILIM